jgi:hypothetical protein
MADKVTAGQGIPRSANLWNNIIDSANEFAQRRRMGDGGGSAGSLSSTDLIKVKNSSGAAIRLGEVLELAGIVITAIDRGSMWFDGDEPDATRPFCIALQDMPEDSIDRAQMSGVTIALVNVGDAGHGYAEVVSGDPVLHSAVSGPVRILYKPSGTGEKTCAVLLGAADPAWECGKLDAEMSYDGTVTVSIWRWNGSAMADTTLNVTARDWLLSSGQTIASGKRVVIVRHPTGQWFVVGAQCS